MEAEKQYLNSCCQEVISRLCSDFAFHIAHTHTPATVQSHHPSGRMLSYLNYETCIYEDCIHKNPNLQKFSKEYDAQEHE